MIIATGPAETDLLQSKPKYNTVPIFFTLTTGNIVRLPTRKCFNLHEGLQKLQLGGTGGILRKYSARNFYRNDYLWNEVLAKDLVTSATNEKAKQLSANYLPMLLQLRNVYQQKEDVVKLKDVDDASDHVGVQCNKYEQVQKIKGAY